MKAWVRDNSLGLALFGLFLVSLCGMSLSGWRSDVQEQVRHGAVAASFFAYLSSGGFLSALFENWESEFLQMWTYVILTAYLFQRGSPESRDPDKPAPQDRDPALDADKPDAPWPVRAGGLARAAYAHSLGLALLTLFVASFVLHWTQSARDAREDALLHGEAAPTAIGYLADPQLWFESFQNWQSEFFSTWVLVMLAIYLRERRSPESKPVSAPHGQTGSD